MEKGRIVGYDRRKFENEAECCTALIHEDGHFESGAFYKPFSVYQVKQQAENKAWRSAFRKRIPWCELKGEILKGFSVWEIAEHFNVTAQCIWMHTCITGTYAAYACRRTPERAAPPETGLPGGRAAAPENTANAPFPPEAPQAARHSPRRSLRQKQKCRGCRACPRCRKQSKGRKNVPYETPIF